MDQVNLWWIVPSMFILIVTIIILFEQIGACYRKEKGTQIAQCFLWITTCIVLLIYLIDLISRMG